MREYEIYDEEYAEALLENDEISSEEEAFMKGYLGGENYVKL
jgi:hypothetical protein